MEKIQEEIKAKYETRNYVEKIILDSIRKGEQPTSKDCAIVYSLTNTIETLEKIV